MTASLSRLSSQKCRHISRRKVLTLLIISPAILSACAQGFAVAAPPEIRYGETLCAECGMIINDARFAAGLAYEVEPGRYQSLAFDDIGDLLVYADKHPEHKIANWYVHDYASEEWIDATLASYVAADSIQTPMGFGIAAHKEHSDAEAMAAETGTTAMTWQELRTYFAKHGADRRRMNDSHSQAMPDAHSGSHTETHAKSHP